MPVDEFWSQLWELAKTAGPFGTGLMFIMWWRADQERIKAHDRNDALLERVLAGLNAATVALDKFSELLRPRRRS